MDYIQPVPLQTTRPFKFQSQQQWDTSPLKEDQAAAREARGLGDAGPQRHMVGGGYPDTLKLPGPYWAAINSAYGKEDVEGTS